MVSFKKNWPTKFCVKYIYIFMPKPRLCTCTRMYSIYFTIWCHLEKSGLQSSAKAQLGPELVMLS